MYDFLKLHQIKSERKRYFLSFSLFALVMVSVPAISPGLPLLSALSRRPGQSSAADG